MEIILLEKIHRLGGIGDRVKVKSGYGRNWLLPKAKAVLATPENLVEFEARRAELEQAEAELRNKALARAETFKDLVVSIGARTADEGKLFGSVGVQDIVAAIKAAGIEVEKSEVHLPNGSIRQLGEYEVAVHLHSDVEAQVKVVVVSDQQLPL